MKKRHTPAGSTVVPLVFKLQKPLPSGRVPVLELVKLAIAPQLLSSVQWTNFHITTSRDGQVPTDRRPGVVLAVVPPAADTLRYQLGEAPNASLYVSVPTSQGLFSLEITEHGASGRWGVLTFFEDGQARVAGQEAVDSMNAYLQNHGLPAVIMSLTEPYAFC